VQAHTLGEVGNLDTVSLRVSSGTILPIFIKIGSYLTDKEQKISWHSFFETRCRWCQQFEMWMNSIIADEWRLYTINDFGAALRTVFQKGRLWILSCWDVYKLQLQENGSIVYCCAVIYLSFFFNRSLIALITDMSHMTHVSLKRLPCDLNVGLQAPREYNYMCGDIMLFNSGASCGARSCECTPRHFCLVACCRQTWHRPTKCDCMHFGD